MILIFLHISIQGSLWSDNILLLGFVSCVVDKHANVLEEHIVSFVSVTELVWLDAEVHSGKFSVIYIRQFQVVWPVTFVEFGKWQ